MTNPTSNFGWQMPTSTDLVTDLPADFETFGQAVDTSLADLKGGTTGQILSKASNTDMDFTWVANDVGDITAVTAGTGLTGGGTSGAVSLAIDSTVATLTGTQTLTNKTIDASTNTLTGVVTLTGTQTLTNKTLTSPVLTTPTISTIDAKGDLLAGTADNTIGRRSIGTNGQVLTADSAEATGMRWATPTSAGASFTLLGTAALTGSTTITVSGLSGYNNLFVTVDAMSTNTDYSFITFKFNSASANHFAFGTKVLAQASYGAGMFTNINQSNVGAIEFGRMPNNVNTNGSGTILIEGSNTTAVKPFVFNAGFGNQGSGADQQNVAGGGYFDAAAVISSISLISSTGNFDGGTLRVYGSVA